MDKYIGAIDQGTTSTRFIVFNRQGEIAAISQKEHRQIYPQPGWAEHDPLQIWQHTQEVITQALRESNIGPAELDSIGVTNQRETTLLWDKTTGKPYHNAIVWQCTRTQQICEELEQHGGNDRFRDKTGLPISTYFSGPKIKWILENVPEAREAAEKGEALFGTMETWVIWWLTGGPRGGAHITDVTNASRTMLMNLYTLDWDDEILDILQIPEQILPHIVPSSDSETWGNTLPDGPLQEEIPVCGAVGDQQAALVGQTCFQVGEAKNTYGTGCFLLMNTGNEPIFSTHGLLTTLAYQFDGEQAVYCLEGPVATAGALVQWLRDNLRFIDHAYEVEHLAQKVEDNAGVYIIPAFSGLLAPYWRPDARGTICGLTGYADRNHIARAALESTAYQVKDIVETMNKDNTVELQSLKADGGMIDNHLLMQFQADILNVPVIRPLIRETTCLGAAYAAGLASGFWSGTPELRENWQEDTRWHPQMSRDIREAKYKKWQEAVSRSFNWSN